MTKYIRNALIGLLLLLTSCSQIKEDKFNAGMARVNILIGEGRIAAAQEAAEALLSSTRGSYGPDHINTATALYELQSLYPDTDDRRVEMLKQILDIRERLYGASSHQAASIQADLGWCYQQRKDTDTAIGCYEDAWPNIDPSESPENYLSVGLALSRLYDDNLRFVKAQDIRKQVLSTYERLGLKYYGDLAFLQELVANADFALGNYKAAQSVGQALLTTKEKAFPRNASTLAETYEFLAACCGRLGENESARKHFDKALQLKEKAMGATDLRLLSLLRDRADFFSSVGDSSHAKEELRRIHSLAEQNSPMMSEQLVRYLILPSLKTLSETQASEGEWSQVRDSVQASLRLATKTYGEHQPELLPILNDLAYAEQSLGNPKEVDAAFAAAETILNRSTGVSDATRISYYLRFADYYQNELLVRKAELYYKKALEIADSLYPPDNATVVSAQNRYAGMLEAEQKYSQKEAFLIGRLDYAQRKLGQQNATVVDLYRALAEFYRQQGDHAAYRKHAGQYIDSTEREIKGENALVANSLLEIGSMYIAQGATEEAKAVYTRLMPLYQAVYGLDHWRIGRCMLDMAAVTESDARTVELYRRSVQIYEAAFGDEHPFLIQVLQSYAASLEKSGQQKLAQELTARAEAIKQTHMIP